MHCSLVANRKAQWSIIFGICFFSCLSLSLVSFFLSHSIVYSHISIFHYIHIFVYFFHSLCLFLFLSLSFNCLFSFIFYSSLSLSLSFKDPSSNSSPFYACKNLGPIFHFPIFVLSFEYLGSVSNPRRPNDRKANVPSRHCLWL